MKHRPRRWTRHSSLPGQPGSPQLLLPGLPLPVRHASPARPARVLGDLVDAGPAWRVYVCTGCVRRWQQPISEQEDGASRMVMRRACPWCNPPEVLVAWGLNAEAGDAEEIS